MLLESLNIISIDLQLNKDFLSNFCGKTTYGIQGRYLKKNTFKKSKNPCRPFF